MLEVSLVLEGGYTGRHSKKRMGSSIKFVCKKKKKISLLIEFHDSLRVGHKGICGE